MTYKHLEMIHITLDDGYFCEVIPSASTDGFHDFYLSRIGCGNIMFMFGCRIDSADHAAELAEANYEEYANELETDEYDD
jgi:hypothetical protein